MIRPMSPLREPAMSLSRLPLRRHACWAVATAVLLLAACAGPQTRVHPGQSEAELLAEMGPATVRHPLADGGLRLEFWGGPTGRSTWMADLDAGGRVQHIEQVLDTWHFARVADGMSEAELLALLGRPSERQREWQQRETWSWHYENNDCLWFRVTLSAVRSVIHGGALMARPQCEGPDGGFR
jgi:hypothetical protein